MAVVGISKLFFGNISYVLYPMFIVSINRLLVVTDTIRSVSELSRYTDQCLMLYNFLKSPKANEFSGGKQFSRLMEQRWSGHLNTTRSILENFSEIVSVLLNLVEGKLNDRQIFVETKSLLDVLLDNYLFCFYAILSEQLLGIISPADKQLHQSRQCRRSTAITFIEVIISEPETAE